MIGPITVLLIFLILFALYGNFKFPIIIVLSVVLTEPVGALLALRLTHTPFSVSSILGLLVLMGVSVETAVIDTSYINKLRVEGQDIAQATFEASMVRLRPIMMTALVACLGLMPAALSHGIGSDSQRPFAIVIVAGLVSRLFLGRIRKSSPVPNGGPRWRRAPGLRLSSFDSGGTYINCLTHDAARLPSFRGPVLHDQLRNAAIFTGVIRN